jgi:hypothetical protein
MGVCDTCGNEYDRTFVISRDRRSGTYDSFECAIQAWAPACNHCGCRIIGHGVDTEQGMFCCEHCARQATASAPSQTVGSDL